MILTSRERKKLIKYKKQDPQIQQMNIQQIAQSQLMAYSNDDNFKDQFQQFISQPNQWKDIISNKNNPIKMHYNNISQNKGNIFQIRSKSTQLKSLSRIQKISKKYRIRQPSRQQLHSNDVCIVRRKKVVNICNYLLIGSKGIDEDKKQKQFNNKNGFLKRRFSRNFRCNRINNNITNLNYPKIYLDGNIISPQKQTHLKLVQYYDREI